MYPNKCPTGVYEVVGWRIPMSLCYEGCTAKDAANIKHVGFSIAQGIARKDGRELKSVTFQTEAECQAAIDAYKASN